MTGKTFVAVHRGGGFIFRFLKTHFAIFAPLSLIKRAPDTPGGVVDIPYSEHRECAYKHTNVVDIAKAKFTRAVDPG